MAALGDPRPFLNFIVTGEDVPADQIDEYSKRLEFTSLLAGNDDVDEDDDLDDDADDENDVVYVRSSSDSASASACVHAHAVNQITIHAVVLAVDI
jgi:hypothetical protein